MLAKECREFALCCSPSLTCVWYPASSLEPPMSVKFFRIRVPTWLVTLRNLLKGFVKQVAMLWNCDHRTADPPTSANLGVNNQVSEVLVVMRMSPSKRVTTGSIAIAHVRFMSWMRSR